MLWHLEQEIKINIQHTNHKTGVFPSILLVPGKCHISSSDKFLCFYKLLQSWKFPWFLENFSLSDSLQFLLLQKIEFKSVKKTGNFLLPSFYPAIIWRRTHLYMKMSIKVIHWFLEEESSDPGPWMHTNTRVALPSCSSGEIPLSPAPGADAGSEEGCRARAGRAGMCARPAPGHTAGKGSCGCSWSGSCCRYAWRSREE